MCQTGGPCGGFPVGFPFKTGDEGASKQALRSLAAVSAALNENTTRHRKLLLGW